MSLPALVSVSEIQTRLTKIFPEGTANRNFVTREIAAKTVFVMLYIGAVREMEIWMRPDQVTRMTDEQAAEVNEEDRNAWRDASMKPAKEPIAMRWYATNTREPIRDETLREGLVRLGAVRERDGLPTTSPKPRYALDSGFMALFNPALTGEELRLAIADWQDANLSGSALARITILRHGVVSGKEGVLVKFPNGETRYMAPGPSSVLSKAIVEQFASRFLERPGVIWLSESREKVVSRDDDLARSIGLVIEPDKQLPDLILVDLGPAQPLLVFVEIVVTAGPLTESRKSALMEIATDAGFSKQQVAFLTAYEDRAHPAFKRTFGELPWNSFAWFMSEPECIVALYRSKDSNLISLSKMGNTL